MAKPKFISVTITRRDGIDFDRNSIQAIRSLQNTFGWDKDYASDVFSDSTATVFEQNVLIKDFDDSQNSFFIIEVV